MAGRPYILAETNWRDVQKTEFEVAVLPWGATEAHNYHLPYATDVIECDHIAAEAARIAWGRGAKVIVLPTVPFGVNTGQLDIPLCINMNPSTQAAVLRDVIDALSEQGLRKLVVLNGHGGNDFRGMLREMQPEYPEIFVSTVNWYQIEAAEGLFEEVGDHAGEMETSNMLHIAPDLVLPLEEAGPGAARRFAVDGLQERWAWAPRRWRSVTDDTGVGDPSAATAAKGERYLSDVASAIADLLVDLARANVDRLYE